MPGRSNSPPSSRGGRSNQFAEVDQSSSLAQGLVAFFVPYPGGMKDALTQRVLIPRGDKVNEDYKFHGFNTNSAAARHYREDVGPVYWNNGGNTGGGWYWPNVTSDDPWSLSDTDTATFAFRTYFDEANHTQSFPVIMNKGTGSGGADGWTIYESAGALFLANDTANTIRSLAQTSAYDAWSDWIITKSGTTGRFYHQESDVSNDTSIGAGNFSSNAADLAIGTTAPTWGAVEYTWEGGIAYLAMWSGRSLDDDDRRRVSVDPWQLLRRDPHRVYSFSASAAVRDLFTRLGMYGGPRGLYGDFSPKTEGVAEPEPETPTGGGRGAKRAGKRAGCRYPRRVMIDGKLYKVCSAEEERQLLEAYRERLEREALELALENAPKKEIAKAKVRVVRAQRRVEEVDDREDAWLDYLKEEDEIIVSSIH